MPIASAWRLISRPPVLPGLIEASVYNTLNPPPVGSSRIALSAPVVTVPCNPRGLPTANDSPEHQELGIAETALIRLKAEKLQWPVSASRGTPT
jgi:hypothetical protein